MQIFQLSQRVYTGVFVATPEFAAGNSLDKNPAKVACYWRDNSSLNNPGNYRPTYEDGYLGADKTGYLVPAVDIAGKPLTVAFIDDGTGSGKRYFNTNDLDSMGLPKARFIGYAQGQIYNSRWQFFSAGGPYLEPLTTQLHRHIAEAFAAGRWQLALKIRDLSEALDAGGGYSVNMAHDSIHGDPPGWFNPISQDGYKVPTPVGIRDDEVLAIMNGALVAVKGL